VAAGIAAPLLRKRLPVPPLLTQSVAFAAPLGLSVATRRTRTRDVAVCALQMWAYLAAYKSPHDDPDAQEQKTRFRYPIAADRAIGLGELPTVRLQRALARVGPEGPQWRDLDRVLVWAHWVWFMVPHGTVAYTLARHPARFPRAAALTYAVFDIGAMIYWVLPTAPPWYAAEGAYELDGVPTVSRAPGRATGAARAPGRATGAARPDLAEYAEGAEGAAVRRMMVEYGEHFWRDGWGPLYSVLGGNPLAAMPSLHFATSLMAALLLTEVGPLAGAVGSVYAATLGFALVYLGEHYVVDLLAGAALTVAVRRLAPRVAPLAGHLARSVAALEAIAHEGGGVAA